MQLATRVRISQREVAQRGWHRRRPGAAGARSGCSRGVPNSEVLTYLLTCYLTLVAHHYRIYTVP